MANISGTMDAMQLDILREIANIGAGHASSALSMMMEMPVEQRVPDVMLVRLEDLNDVLGGAERPVVGVSVSISGDIQGFLLMVLDIEQAKQVVEAIRYQSVETENGELFSFIAFAEIGFCPQRNSLRTKSFIVWFITSC